MICEGLVLNEVMILKNDYCVDFIKVFMNLIVKGRLC